MLLFTIKSSSSTECTEIEANEILSEFLAELIECLRLLFDCVSCCCCFISIIFSFELVLLLLKLQFMLVVVVVVFCDCFVSSLFLFSSDKLCELSLFILPFDTVVGFFRLCVVCVSASELNEMADDEFKLTDCLFVSAALNVLTGCFELFVKVC